MNLLDEQRLVAGVGEGISVRGKFDGLGDFSEIVYAVVEKDFRSFGWLLEIVLCVPTSSLFLRYS